MHRQGKSIRSIAKELSISEIKRFETEPAYQAQIDWTSTLLPSSFHHEGREMSAKTAHKWDFRLRFKARTFGWRSDLPIKRIKEAVSEVRQAARKDKILGAEGAVIFLERLSPAIEQVDSSSGAIGTTVYRAVETLVPIIAEAPASDNLRDLWLDRLWAAVEQDDIPYIEMLPDFWGELCVTPERASKWADRFIDGVRLMWRPDMPRGGYFKGTAACLSGLFAAGRYDELLSLLDLAPYKSCITVSGV